MNSILNFTNSNLGKQIKKVPINLIYKETEFVLKAEDINKSTIQGIIDLYYINETGNIVLIDFKTDKLSNSDDFIDRYSKQLNIYKIALERLTNKKVEKTYIYSFNLNKEIEIKC